MRLGFPQRFQNWDRLCSHGVTGLLGVLALLACIALVTPMVRLWLWTEGLNEGWNASHALHAFITALYPSGNEPRINNYPPLWFYLTGALAKIFGDPVFPGRIIALLAFFAAATAIFAIVYRLGSTLIAGAVAGLSFVAFMAVAFRWWIGAAEPQMLAHAFVTSGAAILVGARTRTMVALAAVLMIMGGLTKHIVVALPLASAAWLAIHRRQLFYSWLLVTVLTGTVALLGLLVAYGGAFIDNVTVPRTFSANLLGTNLGWSVSKTIVQLLGFAGLAATVSIRRDEAMTFAGLYIAAALLSIVAFGGAEGVWINVAIDLVIAASIAFGLVWDRVGVFNPPNLVRMMLVGALVIRLSLMISFPTSRTIAELRNMSADTVALRDKLAKIPGPVACENRLVCLWAGHRNPAGFGPGLRNPPHLLAGLMEGNFTAVVINGNFEPRNDGRHVAGLSTALTRAYREPIHFGEIATLFLSRKIIEP